MVKVQQAILVEGRYDKNTLSQIVDAPIFETSGFGIFKNKEQMALLRRVAERQGLIVFTDSDGAGFVIRNHIKSAIPGKYLLHAYILIYQLQNSNTRNANFLCLFLYTLNKNGKMPVF